MCLELLNAHHFYEGQNFSAWERTESPLWMLPDASAVISASWSAPSVRFAPPGSGERKSSCIGWQTAASRESPRSAEWQDSPNTTSPPGLPDGPVYYSRFAMMMTSAWYLRSPLLSAELPISRYTMRTGFSKKPRTVSTSLCRIRPTQPSSVLTRMRILCA